ncbi:hypothetical protein FRX31_023735 [Thalictrum thalictroides]|uniref:Uncharacterized protein n=1 Tax=Thalictrum thalictroides TaxID=46969 RepID=A0A7J6VQ38_THATH|nr:hypothetical protein FRX31_023735 [Thalictrum thalictroides]
MSILFFPFDFDFRIYRININQRLRITNSDLYMCVESISLEPNYYCPIFGRDVMGINFNVLEATMAITS